MLDSKSDSARLLDAVWSAMSMHPKYMDHFIITHQHLLKGDGPLRAIDRHYIAVMVRHARACFVMPS